MLKSNADSSLLMDHPPLPRNFYDRPAVQVAPQLVGKLLVRCIDHSYLAGIILEAEAYQGEEDLGCHAHAGRTPRTTVMYGPPGRSYVYFTYGMHWMLNAVTDSEGSPAAVLVRAIWPVAGLDQMRQNRPVPAHWSDDHRDRGWTDGPAKLCQALKIDRNLNDVDLCYREDGLWIADFGLQVEEQHLKVTPRIGMGTVPEPWYSIHWRWVLKETERSNLVGWDSLEGTP